MNSSIAEIADQLESAAKSGIPCAPIREAIQKAAAGDAVEAAYDVQKELTSRKINSGARLIGRKIGLTSFAVQKQLGVDSPDFGSLFSDMRISDGEVIPFESVMQPKVEAEVALVLKQDLTSTSTTVEDVVSATEFAFAAIEVVGSRIANWDIRLLDTVADNASSGLFVVSNKPVSLDKLDLVGCRMLMTRGGQNVSEGTGEACLGNPLAAAAWLANVMSKFGTPLRRGDIIMTGALGPMVKVEPGDTFVASIDGLGTVTAKFSS